ncbi:MAG TPA: ECF-type sigma factor [Acidobacteriota bacterium]|nr:ECF-type sigma factor [Acidobacteriota bacterium]
MSDSHEITQLLQEVDAGREGAMDELMETVYADLRRLAEAHLRRRYGPQADAITLEPAALVNESFLKLIKQRKGFDNRQHFFAIATRVMLRVLSDYQRHKGAAKRGGNLERVTLQIDRRMDDQQGIEVDVLRDALERLQQLDARKADVVRLRVVWGLEMKEVAEALEVSLATVERDWAFARSWIKRETQRSSARSQVPGAE